MVWYFLVKLLYTWKNEIASAVQGQDLTLLASEQKTATGNVFKVKGTLEKFTLVLNEVKITIGLEIVWRLLQFFKKSYFL